MALSEDVSEKKHTHTVLMALNTLSPEMIHVSFSHIWEAKSNYHPICSGQARITDTPLKSATKKKKAHFWIKLQTLLCRDFLFLSNWTLLVSGPQEGQMPVGGHRR